MTSPVVTLWIGQNREIRLISVDSSSPNGNIQCTIHDNQSLHDVRNLYVALSYAAGSRNTTTAIQVGDLPFDVFANLAYVLRRIPCEELGNPTLLWTDQMCINQAVTEEKADQVTKIYEIYENAKLVFVWLGGENEDDSGMDLFNVFCLFLR
jgi:hypothetical protein